MTSTATRHSKTSVDIALFDFDGTLSLLRSGWEEVMLRFMVDVLSNGDPEDAKEAAVAANVAEFIDQSTGVQTILQMQWLEEQAQRRARAVPGRDAWWYKEQYVSRLRDIVTARLQQLEAHPSLTDKFLVPGCRGFLGWLRANGCQLLLASGTDHPDVCREARALGLLPYFDEVRGAPVRGLENPKETVLTELMASRAVSGAHLLVVGDGPVEIKLGTRYGARTLGVASDETGHRQWDARKALRLERSGCEWIVGDFQNDRVIRQWLTQYPV